MAKTLAAGGNTARWKLIRCTRAALLDTVGTLQRDGSNVGQHYGPRRESAKRRGFAIAVKFETPLTQLVTANKPLVSHECEHTGWVDRRGAASKECYGRTHVASGLSVLQFVAANLNL